MAESQRLSNARIIWHDSEVILAARRATSRTLVARAERTVSYYKQTVHRLTGTLSRSAHTAPAGYADAGDFKQAATPKQGGSAQDLQASKPASVSMVSWVGDVGTLWAGSFISYADIQEGRDPAMARAFDRSNAEADSILKQAFMEEGF